MKLSEPQFKELLAAYKKTFSETKEVSVPEGFTSNTMLRIRRERAKQDDVQQSAPLVLLWRAALGSSAFSAVAGMLVLQISNSLESSIIEVIISQGI